MVSGARALLEMLTAYNVDVVFGLPGETTLPLYHVWRGYPNIRHVLARDERSAAYMADGYARVSGKPGVCEGPSVGATHLIAGVAEAFKSSLPMIVITSDVPHAYERSNMVTSVDQSALFRGITKATLYIGDAVEIPRAVRLAFRVATSHKGGPVHLRIPVDVLEAEVERSDIYADEGFDRFPAHRSAANPECISKALQLISESRRPLMICGQGVLYSRAWNEVAKLAELLVMPVGTSITGKGSIAETHPLAIGVVGSRGGTSFSNKVLEDADLLFFVGSNTDSVLTSDWRLPPQDSDKVVVHLDINAEETGNNYRTTVGMVGDARATLEQMIVATGTWNKTDSYLAVPRIRDLRERRERFRRRVARAADSGRTPVHPVRVIMELTRRLPAERVMLADPGVSAIYTAAIYEPPVAGRSMIFNYSVGALGYAMPASIGVHTASPESCVVVLTGDGSFGLCAGELETISRIGGNIKIVLFDNRCFGWIQGASRFSYNCDCPSTEFKPVDYVSIAKGFGLPAFRVERTEDLAPALDAAMLSVGPAFVTVTTESESELAPPVPSWAAKAQKTNWPHFW